MFYFGCSSERANEERISLVGTDKEKNNIYKLNDTFYKELDDGLVKVDNVSNVSYLSTPINVPVDDKLKLKIKTKFNDYDFIGTLSNEFYKLEYLLYEKPYDKDSKLEDKLYYYILVKVLEGQYKIFHQLPPRKKIEKNEYIWVTYGHLNLGPLMLK